MKTRKPGQPMPRRVSPIPVTRAHLIARVRARLERSHAPRFDMALIVALTAGSGLLVSFLLLKGGLLHMGWRYLAAFGIAYGVFFLLLWLWLRLRRSDFDLPDPGGADISGSSCRPPGEAPDAFTGQGGEFGGGGASGSFDGPVSPAGQDITDAASEAGKSVVENLGAVADADELALPLIVVAVLLAILAGVLIAAAWIVVGAPTLFAEILLDALLAGGLFRTLSRLDRRHWLEGALRRTAVPFAIAALIVGTSGFVMQSMVPEAHTLGQAVSHWREGGTPQGAR